MEDTKSIKKGRKLHPDSLNEDFPVEVILNINVYLCAQDRWALMRTCRGFHHHLGYTLWHPGPESSHAEQWLRSKYRSIVQRFRISQLDSSHAGALLWAVTRRDCEVARKALQFRAVRTDFVESLLRPAIVLSSCAKLLDLLLSYLPNPEDVINHTRGYAGPLMFSAATSGTLAIFETLLQHGAHPNVQKHGYPIILALSSPVGEAIAPLLIRHGADIPVHVHGWSPLKYAAVHDRAFLLPLISADGVDIHAVDPQSNTHNALCLAVSHDAASCVRLFLEGGSDPMTRAIDGDYAFLLGNFNQKRRSIWRLFLDHGVPVDVRCLHNKTLLMWAALHGDRELVEFLLDRGADATLEDDKGQTAVDCALQNRTWCRKECLDTTAYIIEAGCRQKQGEVASTRWCAPWRIAVSVGQDDLLRHVLKRNGYDHCARDPRGQTLLMIAAQNRAGRAARSYGFAYPWERCRREAMAQTDDAGNTALYWAVHSGDKYLCKRFLRAGADANTPAGDGRSLLAVAAVGDEPAVLRRLLLHVRDVNAQDGVGRTALSYAACNTNRVAMREMVRMLMAAGAKPSRRLRDYNERLRPVGWAKKYGQEDIFRDAVLTWRL